MASSKEHLIDNLKVDFEISEEDFKLRGHGDLIGTKYIAYERAKKDALTMLAEPVPLVIRNAPTKLMKELDYGKGYQYAHDSADKLTDMQCLPDSLAGKTYYSPTDEGLETRFKARLEEIKAWKAQHKKQDPPKKDK